VKNPLLALGVAVAVFAVWLWWRHRPLPAAVLPPQPRTVETVLAAIGRQRASTWRPDFARAGVPYPPEKFLLVGFKEENQLVVFAAAGGIWKKIRQYPILAASGTFGPKRREGDLQVPEGFYRIELLNPNSRFHLSLRVGYPNETDRQRAVDEGRPLDGLGGDIMIHGGAASVGCLAMGDPAAEELFVLAARSGIANGAVWLLPWHPATRPAPADPLSQELAAAVENLP
jgi:hypothetical protein